MIDCRAYLPPSGRRTCHCSQPRDHTKQRRIPARAPTTWFVTRCARLGKCFCGDEQDASGSYIHSQSGQGSIAESGGECSQELLYRACRRVRRACRRILIRCLFPRSSLDRITCPLAWRCAFQSASICRVRPQRPSAEKGNCAQSEGGRSTQALCVAGVCGGGCGRSSPGSAFGGPASLEPPPPPSPGLGLGHI